MAGIWSLGHTNRQLTSTHMGVEEPTSQSCAPPPKIEKFWPRAAEKEKKAIPLCNGAESGGAAARPQSTKRCARRLRFWDYRRFHEWSYFKLVLRRKRRSLSWWPLDLELLEERFTPPVFASSQLPETTQIMQDQASLGMGHSFRRHTAKKIGY